MPPQSHHPEVSAAQSAIPADPLLPSAVGDRDALAMQLREAFEQSPVSTVVYDATGRPIAANPAFERLWGAGMSDVPAGYSILEDAQLEAAGVMPAIRRVFGLDGAATSDGAGEAITLPAIRYDVASTVGRGRTLWTQAHAYPVRDATGAVERVVLSHEDVTARLEAERALRDAVASLETRERRTRAVLESISDAFYALDRDWNFTYVNARAAEILQRPVDALLGRSIWVEFAPALGTAFEREYRRAMDTGRVVTFEAMYEPLSGWFELRAYPGPDGLSVYFRDITERRLAEAALRDAEERLRLALDSTGLGTWDYEPTADRLHWDAQTKAVFGLPQDGEVSDLAAFFMLLHPDDRARVRALVDAATDPAGSGEYDTVFRVVVGEGAERWVRARGRALFTDEGSTRHLARFIGTVLDVTVERGAAVDRERLVAALEIERSRLSAVFAQTPSVMAIVRGPEHVLEMANAAYLALNGNRDVLGKPLLEAIPELRGQGFDRILNQVIETGEPFVGREVPIHLSISPGAPPQERVFDFVYLPLVESDETGVPRRVGVIAHGNDITDQVRARHDVDAARVEAERLRTVAEQANAAKSEFLSTMSHELRTPLNAIAGYTQLLTLGVRGPVTVAQRQDLDRIRLASEYLTGLVTDVLNFARVEAGQVEFDMQDVEVASVLAELEPLIAPQLAAKQIGFDHDACAPDTPDQPHRVRSDPEKLRQILLNLLTNAIKFTDAGGRVSIGCEHQTATGMIGIRVSDTGRGIPSDQLERVFEPFVQVDRHRTEASQQGVGLGLSISRDLARGMGGDLTAESTVGEGSTFLLVLPRA